MKYKSKILISLLLMAMIFSQIFITASAVNTVFDVPTIDPDIQPDNMLYQSPNLNIISAKWSYGLTADIINTSNLDTLITELNANVSTAGYSRSILGIYPNGANLSDSNAEAIRNAGWTEVDLYYETFMVAGSAPYSGMAPVVTKTENEEILSVLADAGCADNAVMVEVSGVNMQWANILVYDKDLSVLNGSTCYAYKYIGDIGRFVPLAECYYGGYGTYFLDIFDLQNAEDDVNGVYVVLTQELPAELVTTKEELPALRESLQQIAEEAVAPEEPKESEGSAEAEAQKESEQPVKSEVSEEPIETAEEDTSSEESGDLVEPENDEKLVLSNTEKTVEWQF